MKAFLTGLFMFVLLLSIGSIGSLFFYGEILFGIVSTILTLVSGICFFTKVPYPNVKNITE